MTDESRATSTLQIADEFRDAPIGDKRLRDRLVRVAEQLSARPNVSLPRAMVTEADLQACYRLFSNDSVSADAVLAPHHRATVERCRAAQATLAVHDGTEHNRAYLKTAQDMGRLREGQHGFLSHVTLMLAEPAESLPPEELPEPLGVLALSNWRRSARRRSKVRGHRRSGAEYAKLKTTESSYWQQHIERVEQQLEGAAPVVHVFDSGGDHYRLQVWLLEHGRRFVTRMARERRALDEDDEPTKVGAWMAEAPVRFETEVEVSARRAKTAPNAARKTPARGRRRASVAVRAECVTLQRPRYLSEQPEIIELHVVSVTEQRPPDGQAPVSWVLLTSEPIGTQREIERVVRIYEARWQIEVYFDALKNGCALSERRLGHRAGHERLLAVMIPIAWQMMLLRMLGRSTRARPAQSVLSPTQIQVLRACGPITLSAAPTAAEALQAVARLGGNIRNRPPGWRVIAHGLIQLLQMEMAWETALSGREM